MTINPFIPIPVMCLIVVLLIITKRKGVWNFIRQIIVALLIFMVNLRIAIPTDEVVNYSNNIDILFVVDNTISMMAEDFDGDGIRMEAVRNDIMKIVDDFEGSRFALISFNDMATVMTPYTTEKENIQVAVNSLEGRSINSAKGSSINVVYNTLRDYLEGSYVDDDEGEDRIVITLINSPQLAKLSEEFQEYLFVRAILLGVDPELLKKRYDRASGLSAAKKDDLNRIAGFFQKSELDEELEED